ncbi:MAG: Sua5/YciO/YrdC/YwlC family protein [Alphaproteobacteria bacterium]|nr:Sua5/YciO/YrdC/YwlC family protein [Alphaproteobacteria bacterium]
MVVSSMIEAETTIEPGAPDERRTQDAVGPEQLSAEVGALLDCLAAGGVAIAPLDVAYAILAATPQGIRRIFDAKQRSYEKPSGMFGNYAMSAELHIMAADRHGMVREMVEQVGLPFSVVAPFREDHPILARVDPFVLESSSKAGTLDMLLNAGQVHDEIARQAWDREMPVFGSSANLSLSGSKYRLDDIDEAVRAAADLSFDYGLSQYANHQGRSSTIIDFRDFSVIRAGVRFETLRQAFKDRFDVTLRA